MGTKDERAFPNRQGRKEEPVFQTEDLIEKRDEMQEKEIDNALKMSLTNVMRYQTNSMSKILASQKNTIKNGKDFYGVPVVPRQILDGESKKPRLMSFHSYKWLSIQQKEH